MEAFIFSIIAFLVCFVAIVIAVWGVTKEERGGPVATAVISGIFGIVLLVFSVIAQIPTGHVGVKSVFSNVIEDEYLPEGLQFVAPWVSVHKMSVRTHSLSFVNKNAITVLSSDGLRMPLDISITYRLKGPDSAWVYQNLGPNYGNAIVIPAVRTGVREASARFTFQELYSESRDKAAEVMLKTIRNRMRIILDEYERKGNVISVQQVLIRNVGLPPKVKESIEKKLQAEQEAQRMVFVLQREEQEAERKRIEAQGIKDFQDIVRQGIDKQLLTWKGIEATQKLAESENAKIVIFGSNEDGLPFMLNTGESK